jgi:platelet-activating factor acetylhydrolase
MTDEKILQTSVTEELPDDHRPDDEWIAARLQIDHEFRKRVAASVQRKFKRNFQGGMNTGYTTGDEMWCHYKPSDEELRKWIEEEGRGEKRLDEDNAVKGDGDELDNKDEHDNKHTSTLFGDAEEDGTTKKDEMPVWRSGSRKHYTGSSQPVQDKYHGDESNTNARNATPAAAADTASNVAPAESWLGLKHALKDGPQQG